MSESRSEHILDGSHAAPMLLAGERADPILKAEQAELGDMFELLAHTELDAVIGEEGAGYVAGAIRHRMSVREGQNSLSFLYRHPKFIINPIIAGHSPLKVVEAVSLARRGRSNALQSHLARRAQFMATVEISQLTVVGQARRELIEPMRDELREFAGQDIDFSEESAYRMEFLGANRHPRDRQPASLIRIGYKNHYSTIHEGSILRPHNSELKGRNTAIIDVADKREFDRDIIRHFQEVHGIGESLSSDPEFMKLVGNLIRQEIDTRFISAENYTNYEVDKHALEKQKLRHKLREEHDDLMRKAMPPLFPQDHTRFPVGDPRRYVIESGGETSYYLSDDTVEK